MIPNRAEFWAYATELSTIRWSVLLLLAPQFLLAVLSGGLGNGEIYGNWMTLVFLGSLAAYFALIWSGAIRQRGAIRALARDGFPAPAIARTVPSIIETFFRYLSNFAVVVCELEDDANLKIEVPVRDWALRGGAIKPGQRLLFLVNRDRNKAVMLRPEYLAYLDTYTADRFRRLLEGTRNERLSSNVLNAWVEIARKD